MRYIIKYHKEEAVKEELKEYTKILHKNENGYNILKRKEKARLEETIQNTERMLDATDLPLKKRQLKQEFFNLSNKKKTRKYM